MSRAEILTVIDSMFDLFISEPGTYTLNVDQTALVTCPGVTLNYIPTRTNYDGTLYLMAKADHDINLTQKGENQIYPPGYPGRIGGRRFLDGRKQ